MPQDYPFTTDNARLTALAIGYKNGDMIAQKVAPLVKVDDETFDYLVFGKEAFSVPQTEVGRKGKVNEVNFATNSEVGRTKDHGLINKIPQKDLNKAQRLKTDIVGNNTTAVKEIITLRNELEVSGIIQDVNNYATANKVTLSGTDQWNDYVNSDPVHDILLGKSTGIVKFNICSMGSVVWDYLRMHPKIIKYLYGENATSGQVTEDAFRVAFKFEEVLIGDSFVNVANIGQPAVMAKTWGSDFAMQHRDLTADTMSQRGTFAYTASWQPDGVESSVTTKVLDKGDYGIDGGLQILIGEHKQALVTAKDFGYLIKDATVDAFI